MFDGAVCGDVDSTKLQEDTLEFLPPCFGMGISLAYVPRTSRQPCCLLCHTHTASGNLFIIQGLCKKCLFFLLFTTVYMSKVCFLWVCVEGISWEGIFLKERAA